MLKRSVEVYDEVNSFEWESWPDHNVIYVLDYVKGELNQNDDISQAIQWAIDDAVKRNGGVVQLPQGTYIANGISKNTSKSVVLRGAGMDRTILRNNSGDFFTAPNPSGIHLWRFEDFQVITATGGGHIFNGSFVQCLFQNVHLIQQLNNKSIVHHDSTEETGGFIENIFLNCRGQVTPTHTVPGFNLRSTNAVNVNSWLGGRYTYSGDYMFHIEGSSNQAFCSSNRFEGINFEVTNGGNIRLKSCLGTTIINCGTYDTHVVGDIAKDLYRIDKSTAGGKCQSTTLIGNLRHGGSLGDGVYDIRVEQGSTTILINNSSTVLDYDTYVSASSISGFLSLNDKKLGNGIVMSSPNGTFYRASFTNDGTWQIDEVTVE